MRFSKYHGCGNDFIIGVWEEGIDYPELVKKLCNRYTGIGADGFMLAKGTKPVEMVFYNADGSRGLMCGNGIRCLSKFILDNNIDELVDGILTIKTLSGIRTIKVEDGLYKVNMGKPDFNARSIGINEDGIYEDRIIEVNNKKFSCNAIFMTVDHLVVIVNDFNISDEEAKYIHEYKDFPRKLNVNFVKILDRDNIIVRTYERGVGWTKACGSGCSATFALLNKRNLVNELVTANLEYGKIELSHDEFGNVIMKGPSECISNNIEIDL